MNKSNNKGFTLVELSIVLVIIGLLIGGILAAQSMIETTKIQAFTRQIGQFDAAVVNFGDKFGGLPGDTSAFDTAPGTSGPQDNGLVDANEAPFFWTDLTNSGLKREEGAGLYGTAGKTPGVDFPRAKVGSSGSGVLAVGTATVASLGLATAANVYIVADCTGATAFATGCKSSLTGSQAIAIDSKLDDGVGNTGNVQGYNQSAASAGYTDFTTGPGAVYAAGNTVVDALVIRMGLSTGVLK